jgi:hypothetical protein
MKEHFPWLTYDVKSMQQEDPNNASLIGEVAFNLYMSYKILDKRYYLEYSNELRLQLHESFLQFAKTAMDLLASRSRRYDGNQSYKCIQ